MHGHERARIIREARATERSFERARGQFSRDMVRHYHELLADQVTHASPMLLDLCGAWTIGLRPLLRRLRPPRRWLSDDEGSRARRPSRSVGESVEGERLHAVVIGDGIQVRATLGDGLAVTRDGILSLWLQERWPETIMLSIAGRPLADVVDHPVLRMRPYPILRSLVVGNGMVIEASAPDVTFRVPWVRAA